MAVKMLSSQGIIDNVSVEQFYGRKDKYNFDLLLQRGTVWNLEKKSNFIVSLLLNREIPNLVVNKKSDGNFNFLDGVNRSHSIIDFLNGDYTLSYDLENIIISNKITNEDNEYEIAGKKFLDFDQKLQNHLLTRILYIKTYDGLSDEEESITILNLNEGVPMLGMTKARVIGYNTVTPFINEIINTEFFERKVNITGISKRKFIHEQVVCTILGLELNVYEEVSLTSPIKIIKYIKDNNLLTEKVENEIKKTIDYLNECIPIKHRFLIPANIIPIYLLTKQAIQDEVEYRYFYDFINKISENTPESYKELANKKWTLKSVIDAKLDILLECYGEYMTDNCVNW